MAHENILLAFTGILAFAVLLQSLLFIGIYRSIRQMNDWLSTWSKEMLKHAQIVSSRVEEGVSAIQKHGGKPETYYAKLSSCYSDRT